MNGSELTHQEQQAFLYAYTENGLSYLMLSILSNMDGTEYAERFAELNLVCLPAIPGNILSHYKLTAHGEDMAQLLRL